MRIVTLKNSMMAAVVLSGVCCGCAVPTADAAEPFGGKHVLVIGIDGFRCDALQAAKVPHLRGLIDTGTVCYRVYTGGKVETPTQQPTGSGSGWSSILTGVWIDKHHVAENKFTGANFKQIVDGKITGYPHFFTRIKQCCPDCYLASIVNWQPINEKIVSDADYQDGGNDAEVAKKCAELLLSDRNPSVIFLQFDQMDGAGHSMSYSPQSLPYMAMAETIDQHVGTVLTAMRQRPSFAQEDWLVLVTTDHGGFGRKHGNQSPEERSVFLIANGRGYPHTVLDSEWGIVAVPPTVLRHLGLAIDPAWGWESPPLVAEEK